MKKTIAFCRVIYYDLFIAKRWIWHINHSRKRSIFIDNKKKYFFEKRIIELFVIHTNNLFINNEQFDDVIDVDE